MSMYVRIDTGNTKRGVPGKGKEEIRESERVIFKEVRPYARVKQWRECVGGYRCKEQR